MKELYNLAKILRATRKSYDLTQKQVAEKLGIKYQSYQSYELGITIPDLKHFILLADIFGVSMEYLVGRREY